MEFLFFSLRICAVAFFRICLLFFLANCILMVDVHFPVHSVRSNVIVETVLFLDVPNQLSRFAEKLGIWVHSPANGAYLRVHPNPRDCPSL